MSYRCPAPARLAAPLLAAPLLAAPLLAAPLLVALLAAAGCGDDEPEGAHFGPSLTLDPASVMVRAGESTLVAINAAGTRTGTARWTIDSQRIAWVDSTTRAIVDGRAGVYLHAVAPGRAVLQVVARLHDDAQTVTGSVPVTVLPRAP